MCLNEKIRLGWTSFHQLGLAALETEEEAKPFIPEYCDGWRLCALWIEDVLGAMDNGITPSQKSLLD